jgi:hypothetical protein
MLYHARVRLGMEGWIRVMEDYNEYPTINSLTEKWEDGKCDLKQLEKE